MNRCIRVIVTMLSMIVVFSSMTTAAELAKEGSGAYRSGRSAKVTVLKLGEERLQINFDETGIVVEAPADSPFVNASFNTMGTVHAVDGNFTYSGAALWTRPNGEQIYGVFKGHGKLGASTNTSLDIVGGQGACTGITGSMELTAGPYAKSSKQGYSMGTTVGTVRWKIP